MLIDSFERRVNYLRVSVTQRCNFRCRYCMPEKPFEWTPKENILSYEELFAFIKVAIDEGVSKIRITGGEPLVRDDLDSFVKMICNYAPKIDVAITTNGVLLERYAKALANAGLKRLNISLDSLERTTFHHLSKKDALESVLKGIDAALQAGLKVKLNSVIIKGINEREILPLYEYAKSRDMEIRFIEFMENESADRSLRTVSSAAIIEAITGKYAVAPLQNKTHSAAKPYMDEDGYTFGIIEPYDDSFCKTCNRIRLSAEGDLIPCLYYEDAQSIKPALGGGEKQLHSVLHDVVANKPEKNRWSYQEEQKQLSARAFYYTGG